MMRSSTRVYGIVFIVLLVGLESRRLSNEIELEDSLAGAGHRVCRDKELTSPAIAKRYEDYGEVGIVKRYKDKADHLFSMTENKTLHRSLGKIKEIIKRASKFNSCARFISRETTAGTAEADIQVKLQEVMKEDGSYSIRNINKEVTGVISSWLTEQKGYFKQDGMLPLPRASGAKGTLRPCGFHLDKIDLNSARESGSDLVNEMLKQLYGHDCQGDILAKYKSTFRLVEQRISKAVEKKLRKLSLIEDDFGNGTISKAEAVGKADMLAEEEGQVLEDDSHEHELEDEHLGSLLESSDDVDAETMEALTAIIVIAVLVTIFMFIGGVSCAAAGAVVG